MMVSIAIACFFIIGSFLIFDDHYIGYRCPIELLLRGLSNELVMFLLSICRSRNILGRL
jgi:hypothetical protein